MSYSQSAISDTEMQDDLEMHSQCFDISNIQQIKADLNSNVTWHPETPLNNHQSGQGKLLWITTDKLCIHATTDTTVSLNTQLLISFALPDQQQVITLKVLVVQCDSTTIIARHLACHKSSNDQDSDQLVIFLAHTTWNIAFKTYESGTEIETCQANRYAEFRNVSRLLYKEYRIKGYCPEQTLQSYFNYFAILPDSKTFLINRYNELIGTFSFIADSPFGLPCESIYIDEIKQLRKNKRKIAELSLLAFDADKFSSRSQYLLTDPFKLYLFVRLVKSCINHACLQGFTDLLVATNPIHARNYQLLMFEQIGEQKSYQSACGNPAILLRADLNRLTQFTRQINNRFNSNLVAYLYAKQYQNKHQLNSHIAALLEQSCPAIPDEVVNYLNFCYGRL
ncbi:MAG: hypothetical protein K0U68_07990 [Gammaproteobacteria bacterium]|nr:hypothetical protein [Gammaproteobacteria bacterium]